MPFVVFEGVDGVGKTTQINLLRKYLKKTQKNYYYCYEPGSSAIGAAILPFLKNPHPQSDLTHTLLVLAARHENIRQHLIPHQSRLIICDRFMDSTYVYQGSPFCPLNMINSLAKPVVKDLMPDLTFVLTANAHTVYKRLQERGRNDEIMPIERVMNLNASYRDLIIKHMPYPCGKVPKRVLIKTDGSVETTHEEIVNVLKDKKII